MKGRLAFVTGAANGIGAAVAERLAADGAQVLAFDCDSAALERLAARTGARAFTGDVTSQEDVDRAMAWVASQGTLHSVINAAGIVTADEPADVEDATWERMLAVNLTGTMRVCRAALPLLRAAGGGTIVNVASVAAFNATPGSASYAPSKAGVVAYTRALALSHGREGIRANAVCPGWTRTPMADREMDEAAAHAGTTRAREYEAIASALALRRIGEAREIASCVCFLAGPDASFVTGATLVVDGGGRIPAAARAL
jgi:NAD(P)-dependent dehydrogenase (short-subunit alcohol dehydrogenase family)